MYSALINNRFLPRAQPPIPPQPSEGFADGDSDGSVTVTSTSSTTFVDGGVFVTAPNAGDYLIIFEAETVGSAGAVGIEIAIGKNSTAVAEVGTPRRRDGAGANRFPMATTAFLAALVPADIIRGIFRRSAGAGGQTATLANRRISMWRIMM
jgi:hypothetical protein